MQRIAIVRNLRSGRGKGTSAWQALEARLCDALGERLCRIEETTGPGSAEGQARALAAEGFEVVVAAGGDGTASQVMQGLLGSASTLGMLPLGTGNDFARTIGVGPNVQLAIDALVADRRARSDVGKWTQGEREGHFLNVAGCGFDAAVAARINSGIRRLRGRPAYLAAIVQTLIAYRPTLLRLTIDGEQVERKGMLCAVANAMSYGGGMRVAPLARIDDCVFDLVLVGDVGRLEFVRAFPSLLKGTHLAHPKVEHRTFRSLEIESDPPSPFLVDGELLPTGKVRVEVVPGAIEVVVGKSPSE